MAASDAVGEVVGISALLRTSRCCTPTAVGALMIGCMSGLVMRMPQRDSRTGVLRPLGPGKL
ncbi:hypothetical protein SSCG_06058 [Streptomyces clavuligerus]|nr:hypothetical protein SSCG_06058 [Streptomyces clavuligerus]